MSVSISDSRTAMNQFDDLVDRSLSTQTSQVNWDAVSRYPTRHFRMQCYHDLIGGNPSQKCRDLARTPGDETWDEQLDLIWKRFMYLMIRQ